MDPLHTPGASAPWCQHQQAVALQQQAPPVSGVPGSAAGRQVGQGREVLLQPNHEGRRQPSALRLLPGEVVACVQAFQLGSDHLQGAAGMAIQAGAQGSCHRRDGAVVPVGGGEGDRGVAKAGLEVRLL